MSTQITTAMRNQFSANVMMLSQQLDSRVARVGRQESLAAEFGFFDQTGAVEMVELTSRHQDTPFTEVPHSRRRVAMRDFVASEIIDKQDATRVLLDPNSAYTQAFAAAYARMCDREFIRAYFDPAATGKTGATSVNFLAGNIIANNYVESGGAVVSGLTIAKMRRAKELLDAAEAGVNERRYIVCGARQIRNLLGDNNITSADYNTVRALVNGEVNTFLGFDFIRTELVPYDTTTATDRKVMAFTSSGMLFANGMEMEVNSAPDPTKNFNTRLHARATFGATRMEEARCIDIRCSEA